jgi:hypothetical protein
MVSQALTACPAIAYKDGSNRAEHGAQIMLDGDIKPHGTGVWRIGLHSVTKTTCSCEDRLAPVTKAGTKLCKHVYAVRMQCASEQSGDALVEFLQDNIYPGQTTVLLTIETDYDKATRHIVIVGHPSVARRSTLAEAQPVTLASMSQALARLGWSLVEAPQRVKGGFGMDYNWKLRTDTGGRPLTPAIWDAKGRTEEEIARWEAGKWNAPTTFNYAAARQSPLVEMR